MVTLNESPSEKEGKLDGQPAVTPAGVETLNESPSEKEGKSACAAAMYRFAWSLNESPSEKEGKSSVLNRANIIIPRPQ